MKVITDPWSGYRTRVILRLLPRDAEGRVTGVYQAVNKKTGRNVFTTQDHEHLLDAIYTAEVLKTAKIQAEIEVTQCEIIFTKRKRANRARRRPASTLCAWPSSAASWGRSTGCRRPGPRR